jgi:hypothetical protein
MGTGAGAFVAESASLAQIAGAVGDAQYAEL